MIDKFHYGGINKPADIDKISPFFSFNLRNKPYLCFYKIEIISL